MKNLLAFAAVTSTLLGLAACQATEPEEAQGETSSDLVGARALRIEASATTVAAGASLEIKTTVTLGARRANTHVLVQIVDEAYQVVDKWTVDGQTFEAGKGQTFTHGFALPKTLAPGTYYVSAGVFRADWSKPIAYSDRGASFSVDGTASAAPGQPAAGGGGAPTGAPVPTYPVSGPLTLAWHEEFDGDLSKWIDHEAWQSAPGADAYGGASWFPIPVGAAADVSSGLLTLKSRACDNPKGLPICGAEISTRGKYESFVHGYVEARVKVANNAGGFPALWLLGNGTGDLAWPKTGEIDIFEFVNNGRDEGIPFFTVHWSCPTDPWNHCSKSFQWPARLPSFSDDFHVWGLTRTADLLETKIDGVVSSRITRDDLAAIGGNYDVIFNEPMHVRVDIANGGEWAGDPNRAPAAGDLVVDYIRAWDAR